MNKVIKWNIIYPDLIVLLVSLTNHPSLLIAHHNIIAFSYFPGSFKNFPWLVIKNKTSILFLSSIIFLQMHHITWLGFLSIQKVQTCVFAYFSTTNSNWNMTIITRRKTINNIANLLE